MPNRDPGNELARTILTEHRGRLVGYFRRRRVPKDDIEDLLQEVVSAACAAVDTFDPDRSKLGAWLIGIAANVTGTYWQRPYRRREEPGDPADLDQLPLAGSDPEGLIMEASRRGMLDRMLASMPDEQREIFELHVMGGMTIGAIAEAKGIPEGTAWTRYRAGRQHCVAWFKRWQAAERRKGRDGRTVVMLPWSVASADVVPKGAHAPMASASRWLGLLRRGAMVRGGVAMIALASISPPRGTSNEAPIPVAPALIAARLPIPPPTPPPPPEPAPPPAAAPPSVPAARRYAATDDDLRTELTYLGRAETAMNAGNHAEAHQLLLEHRNRFPDGLLAAKRNRLIRGMDKK